MDRSDEVTRLVADWARADPVHGPRLRGSAQRGTEQLERVVYNLLRYGGGAGASASKVQNLRSQLSPLDVELVDWNTVAQLVLTQ